jgi:outer membrane protein assembly factor BamB
VADDVVYVGSWDRYVYALDGEDGAEQWRFQTGDAVDTTAAVVEGGVYIGSADGNLYALGAAEGGAATPGATPTG